MNLKIFKLYLYYICQWKGFTTKDQLSWDLYKANKNMKQNTTDFGTATKRQRWALFCLSHLDYREKELSKEEAAAMIEAGLDEVDAGIVICHDCHVCHDSSVKGMPSLP